MRTVNDPYGGYNPLVDKQIGNTYPQVHAVSEYLKEIVYLAHNLHNLRPQDVEIRANTTERRIEWRYAGMDTWQQLSSYADMMGADVPEVVQYLDDLKGSFDIQADRITEAESITLQAKDDTVQAKDITLGAKDTAVESAQAASLDRQAIAQDAAASSENRQIAEQAKTAAELARDYAQAAGLSHGAFALKTDMGLDAVAGKLALVYADPIATNNGQYFKIGDVGTGSWQKSPHQPVLPAELSAVDARIELSKQEIDILAGESFRFKGPYAPDTEYAYRDIVKHGSGYYLAANPITKMLRNYAWNPQFINNGQGWSIFGQATRASANGEFTVTATAPQTGPFVFLAEQNTQAAPTGPNTPWSVGVEVYNGGAIEISVYTRVFFVGASNFTRGTSVVIAPGTWARVIVENASTPVALTTGATIGVFCETNVPTGHAFKLRKPIMVQGATVPEYFDGESVSVGVSESFSWAGERYFSDSIKKEKYGTGLLKSPEEAPESWSMLLPATDGEVEEIANTLADSREEIDILATEAFRFRGLYSPTKEYAYRDIVEYEKAYYSVFNPVGGTTKNSAWNPRFVNAGSGWALPGFAGRSTDGTELVVNPTAQLVAPFIIATQPNERAVPAAADQIWSSSVEVFNGGEFPISAYVRVFFVGAGHLTRGDTVEIPPGEWRKLSVDNASSPVQLITGATMSVYSETTVGTGHELRVRRPVLSQSATAPEYFDGSMPREGILASYAWEGVADFSPSIKITKYGAARLLDPVTAPNVWAYLLPATVETPKPTLAPAMLDATLTSKQSHTIIGTLSRDRTVGWNIIGSAIRETYDDGETWTQIHNFTGENIESVMELSNRELVIATAPSNSIRKLYVSSGYRSGGAVTFEHTLSSHAISCKFSPWGMYADGPMVLINEYGPKAGYTWSGGGYVIEEGDNARYCFMSLDYGKTWKTIFDLNEWLPGRLGIHMHGVAYDKWWNRIWLTYGDGTHRAQGQGGTGTLFSDDLGKTWHAANMSEPSDPAPVYPNSTFQNVFIRPMEDCILFGTDTSPNGVHRIDRKHGKHKGTYPIDIAFEISDDTNLAYLCHYAWYAEEAPNALMLFAFGCETQSRPSCIVATKDGWTFAKIWEDTVAHPVGFGLRTVVGPTRSGMLIAASNDQRVPSVWTQISGEFPQMVEV